MSPFLRFKLRQILRIFGVRLRAGIPVSRDMDSICRHLNELGFNPKTIVDVGVADGTLELYRHFKSPYLVLVEPMVEFKSSIEAILQRYAGEAHFVAAGAEDGSVEFGVGSDASAFHNAKPVLDGAVSSRTVPSRRLDTIMKNPVGPIMLKIDVEGFELAVIDGATDLLKNVEVAILETRLFDVIGGTSIFAQVCARMAAEGYEVYDIIDMIARPLDGALVLCDIVFVRHGSALRSDPRYETEDQAKRHARRLLPTVRRFLKM